MSDLRDVAPEIAVGIQRVRGTLRSLNGVVVAFSGGVDSSVLAWLAHDTLGTRALACMAVSPIVPRSEIDEARGVARQIGIRLEVLDGQELDHEAFVRNASNRCYVCKGLLFGHLRPVARREGIEAIAYGEIADDADDYRPGVLAAREAGIIAPLAAAGLTKADIRAVARTIGLPNAEKPAAPCLASRIPYGRRVTTEELAQVERAEEALHRLGFGDLRVRHLGAGARVELLLDELPRALHQPLRSQIEREMRAAGFDATHLDQKGFRSGNLNNVLSWSASSNDQRWPSIAELPLAASGDQAG
jgi:pyridinium-3,5-biscarboxylic acid mononucleotide sulfurtransferase